MFQMNFKGIYLIFLNRLKEMFLSLQELTYSHSVPSNPCPIQPRSPLLAGIINVRLNGGKPLKHETSVQLFKVKEHSRRRYDRQSAL
jgi:hypothetical protein